jgi:hypothetical protein
MLDAWLRATARLHLSYAELSIAKRSSDHGAAADLRSQLVKLSLIAALGLGCSESLDFRGFRCSERGGQARMRTIRRRRQNADDPLRALHAQA